MSDLTCVEVTNRGPGKVLVVPTPPGRSPAVILMPRQHAEFCLEEQQTIAIMEQA